MINNENSDNKIISIKRLNKRKSNASVNVNNIKLSSNYSSKNSIIPKNGNFLNKKKGERSINDNINIKKRNSVSAKKKQLLNTSELNSLPYEVAIESDKRTYCEYYTSLLIKKQMILFTFLPQNDYNLMTLKILLFILSFSLYFTVNAFFFTDDTMNKISIDNGKYNFLFQLPQMIYSSLITSVINGLIKLLSLFEKDILSLKKEDSINLLQEKAKKTHKKLKIKLISFFISAIILMIFFWYFISCFCAVYRNTQIILIKDTLLSFLLSMFYPFGIVLIPGIFRIRALRCKNKNKKCMYSISNFLALF